MNRLLLLAPLAMSYSSFSGEVPTSISQWVPTTKKLSQVELIAANNDGTTWDVYLDGEDVKIRPYDFSREKDIFLKFGDGRLISDNKGEFGAAVYWETNDGRKSKISEHHIEQFIQVGTRLFAIAGLIPFHDSGEVLELKRKKGGWNISRFAKLNDVPMIALKENATSVLVLTYSTLSRVSLEGKTELIVANGEWNGLIPRSLIMDGKGFVYVGFNQRVAKVDLKTGQAVYLIPYPEIFADDVKRHKKLQR